MARFAAVFCLWQGYLDRAQPRPGRGCACQQQDDVQSVSNWTENQQLAAVSDDQARQWVSDDRLLWAVAIKPWVLVQELDNEV